MLISDTCELSDQKDDIMRDKVFSTIITIYYGIKLYLDHRNYKRRAPKDHIFLLLQVRTDSQVLCHSQVKYMEEVVDICISVIEKYHKRNNTKLALIVRNHLLDKCSEQIIKTIKTEIHKNHFPKPGRYQKIDQRK